MKFQISAATLFVLAAGLTAPPALAADFWLQGHYSAWMVKRGCDTRGGQFHVVGGIRYRCDLADGRSIECTTNRECRAHVPSSSASPPSPRTLQGFLADNAGGTGAAPLSGRITIGGGRHLYLEFHGSGSPTVVLDAGHRGRGDFWNHSDDPKATPVLAGVQQFTRVCTYDRPGTILGLAPKDFSRSDPVPMPRNAAAAVTDLHELLGAAKVPGPYVLVGHSFGGLDILLYALNYPRSVAGIVFVDALPPELRNQMTPSLWKTYSELIPQPLPGLHYKELETMDFSASLDEVQRALGQTRLPAIPIVVLTKDRPFDLSPLAGRGVPAGFGEKLDAAWRRAQQQLAASIAHVPLTVVETSHDVPIERPDVVIDAIRRVVEAVRSGRKTVTQ